MGVNIEARDERSHIVITIDYALPASENTRWLDILFGLYSRWCVRQMARDLVHQFGTPTK